MEAPGSISRTDATEYSAAGPRKGKRRRPPEQAPEPVRKSRRLREQLLHKTTSSTLNGTRAQDQLPSPSSSRTPKADSPHPQTAPLDSDIRNSKRKAEVVIDDTQNLSRVPEGPHLKRPRTWKDTSGAGVGSDRIHHWVRESHWPRGDFEPDPDMSRPPPKRSRSASSQGRQSNTDTPVPSDGSDQRSRAWKSSPYAQSGYATLLAYKKSYMCDSEVGILASEKRACKDLLNKRQSPPSDTLFDEECFLETFANIQDENEMRVVIDLLRLIAPSAENLAARGLKALKQLKEHTNAGWNESVPVQGPRPQPDYCVGFRFKAFTDDQFNKLRFHLRLDTRTYFSATLEMFFPFLTSEVKCGKQALDIADRQNAHSMTVAIRGIVELFRKIGRAKDLHRKALGFSISHDNRAVRIYVHYPEIDGLVTECYRHTLREFIVTDNDGKERWAAYQFVRNVYESFAPMHLKRIRSAVDQLPDPIIESSQPVPSNEGGGDSQDGVAPGASSSHETNFVKPNPLSNRGVAAELRRQLEQEKEQAEQREETQRKQNEELTEERRLMREEIKHREEQLRDETARFHKDTAELRAQIDQLIEQSKQREEQQRRQIDQLIEQSKQREEQQQRQIDKLTDMIARQLR